MACEIEKLQKSYKNLRNFNLSNYLWELEFDANILNAKFLSYSDSFIFIKLGLFFKNKLVIFIKETKRSFRRVEEPSTLKFFTNIDKIENPNDSSSFMPLSPKSMNLNEIFINAPIEKSFISKVNKENKENQISNMFRVKEKKQFINNILHLIFIFFINKVFLQIFF